METGALCNSAFLQGVTFAYNVKQGYEDSVNIWLYNMNAWKLVLNNENGSCNYIVSIYSYSFSDQNAPETSTVLPDFILRM